MYKKCGMIEDVCRCQSSVLTIEKIYIVDLKGATGTGGVVYYNSEPEYKSFLLENEDRCPIRFIEFQENAFQIRRGRYEKQCECALYPETASENTWMLFIEMKYAGNEYNILLEDWHRKAVEQIRKTVNYLRSKGVLDDQKKLMAVVSFPKIDTFSSWLTEYIQNELESDEILARCTNKATIVDDRILILA